MNIIFGRKEVDGRPKDSLNSIGKSTVLDLIDFCLGASAQKQHNPRLNAAKKILKGYDIALDVTIGGKEYTLKRSIDSPNVIEVIRGTESKTIQEKQFKLQLGKAVFGRENYKGEFNSNWFRKLMGFYLKIQKFKKEGFTDPVKFIREISESEINIYHFYLLGFDNTIAAKNFRFRSDIKRIEPTIKEVTRFVHEKYNLAGLKETQNEINKLKLDIRNLENSIDKFELGEQYKETEEQANKLTEQIKNFLFQNHLDREKIDSYQKSQVLEDDISTRRITRIFKEIDEDFGKKVSKTLSEAISFRKELSKSRSEFLNQEIERLNSWVEKRNEKIKELEQSRAKLFRFLSEKEAITDLTESFYNLSSKRKDLTELQGNSKILMGLSTELSEIETEITILKTECIKFLQELSDELSNFYQTFSDVFNSIYIGNKGASNFTITENFNKDSLLEISIVMPDMFGKGKNQGRSLIYDLAVLLHSTKEESNLPRFLIHDGIFDGMDKSHFISTYDLVEEQARNGIPIQYITTLNEEGTLSNKFGQSDILSPEQLENEAILVLSPTKKLFGQNF